MGCSVHSTEFFQYQVKADDHEARLSARLPDYLHGEVLSSGIYAPQILVLAISIIIQPATTLTKRQADIRGFAQNTLLILPTVKASSGQGG